LPIPKEPNNPRVKVTAPTTIKIVFTLGFLAFVRVALVGTLVLVLLSTVLVDN
jgi:hypothetical protein